MKNLKKFDELQESESVNEAKGKKVWIGVMPGALGYGLTSVGDTEKEATETLKKGYDEFMSDGRNDDQDDFNTFKKAMEYFGGRVTQVEMGKSYYDNFGE